MVGYDGNQDDRSMEKTLRSGPVGWDILGCILGREPNREGFFALSLDGLPTKPSCRRPVPTPEVAV